ncbi:transporter substrate-binding domain-containing protein, partial [Rhizobium ruizarguesonis]
EMKEKCSIVEISWDGLIPALQSKNFDVIWSSMSNTAERSKVIDFTDKYYNTPSTLIGPKDQKPGATAGSEILESLIERLVGLFLGSGGEILLV